MTNYQLDSSLCLEIRDIEFKEALWCKIRTAIGFVMIGLCYRSPSSLATNNDQLLDMFRAAVSQRNASHVMIFGDFNYPDIDYSQDMVAAGDDAAFLHHKRTIFATVCVAANKIPTKSATLSFGLHIY